MATETIHHPVENLDLLRRLAEPLGYSSLKTWFGQLDPSLKPRPSYANLPESDTHPEYGVRFIGGYIRGCASLSFIETVSPQEKVTIRARKDYVGSRDPKIEELDFLGTSELAWKRGVGNSFDLVARGTRYRNTYDPKIATVESAQALTPHTAEVSLQKIALLVVDPPAVS